MSLVDYGKYSSLWKQSAKLTANSIGHDEIADFRKVSRLSWLNLDQNGGLLRSPGIDSARLSWWAGMSNRFVLLAYKVGNRFLGSLIGLKIQALYSC